MISELFDKLSIIIIRTLVSDLNPGDKYLIIDIEKDLRKKFYGKKINKQFLFYLNLLVQVNYEIWKIKDHMHTNKGTFKKNELKLSHQINSIRNIIKNKIQALSNNNKDVGRTNTDKEDLKGWNLYLLSDKKFAFKNNNNKFNIADYLDNLSILQIKERKFNNIKYKKNLESHLNNFTSSVDGKNYKIIIVAAFLSAINNYVWDIKDKIVKNKSIYHSGLSKAQNLNSLRNELKNYLNNLNNQNLSLKTGIFYDNSFYEKVIILRNYFGLKKVSKDSKFDYVSLNQIKNLILDKNEKLKELAENIYNPKNFIYFSTDHYRDDIIKDIVKKIKDKNFWISGKDKNGIWQKGWNENLKSFSKTKKLKNLVPKFLKKKLPLRFENKWIKPFSENFEFDMIEIYRTHLFKKYFDKYQNIYEFGCGSAQHLIRLCEIFPKKKIIGLDWSNASLKIIQKIKKEKKLNIESIKFNLFKPNYKVDIKKNSLIFTVGTMEQLGSDYKNFFEYIISKKPQKILHLETIEELYNENNLFDYLAKIYDKERNYLNGYLSFLKEKEKEKKIKIIKVKKFNFGSMMHDSYSLIIWKPL